MLERDPRVLLRPRTWLRLGKLAAVLAVETALAPAWRVALRARPADALEVLETQNRFRRWALGWIYPELVEGPEDSS